ncbi:MAG: hypothetical protein ABFC56_04235 [Clostridiaceae bacterium]
MSEIRYLSTPSGVIALRQPPEFHLELALRRAKMRAFGVAALLKRRTDHLEGTMYPDQHNYLASPIQGSTLNAGQFGNLFAQHPCRGCDAKRQAYDAAVPAHPQRKLRHLLTALLRTAQ